MRCPSKLSFLIIGAVIILNMIFFLSAQASELNANHFYVPAEWAPQESVWLAWPEYLPAGRSNVPQILDIMAAITPNEDIDLIVNDPKEADLARAQIAKRGISMAHVRLHFIKHTDFWMRDVGAIFMRNPQGQREAVAMKFNSWGMGAVSNAFQQSSLIDGKIAAAMAEAFNVPVIHSFLVMEGGGLEFNGKGTLIVTQAVILQPQRNPGLTRQKVEDELKRIFNLKKVIWLQHGIRADDSTFYGTIQSQKGPVFTALTTNGHTDEYVRWINDHTVLLAEVSNAAAEKAGPNSIAAITRDRLEDDYKILKQSANQEGHPIDIIRVPVAEDIFETLHAGDSTFDGVTDMFRADVGHHNIPVFDQAHQKSATFISATSYLNYLVTNKVVLMPKYWKPGYPESMREKDALAKSIIAAAFPGRKIIQINNMEDINIGGGGIHCITQQMPKVSWK